MKHCRIFVIACLVMLLAGGSTQAQTNKTTKLRLGVVGFHHGHFLGFWRNYAHREDIEIVGYAEPDVALADEYTKKFKLDPKIVYHSVDEMMEAAKPQAIVTYTSTFDHRAVAESAAKHHIPMMMEKPLATTYEDALAMQKLAEEAKIPMLVNYETSWYRSNHAAYDMLKDGKIGELRKVVVHDGHQGPKEIGCGPEFLSWLTDPKLNGAGALFDFGCYGADLGTWLMDGAKPTSVTAVAQHIKPDIYPKVEDEGTIIVTYPKMTLILQASWNWPYNRKDMEVYGRTGCVLTVAADDIRVRLGNRRETLEKTKPLPQPYDDQITYLRAVVLDGAKIDPLSSIETNVTVVQILDAAKHSADMGQTIRFDK
jgi:glucose-fructose oxidoreductase